MEPSSRSAIPPFYVMEVMKAAAAYERQQGACLHMEVGQPSTAAPAQVVAAAHAALDGDRLGYTAALGLPPLRQRIARFYDERYDLAVPSEEVAVTIGASAGFILTFLAAFDEGDRVVVTEPGYPAYRNILEALGIEVVGVPIDATSRYVLKRSHLQDLDSIDGLVIASPSNPTGTTMTSEELAEIAAWCTDNDVRLVSDEIYHGITFTHEPPTARSLSDSAVVVQSFSKYFSMTGWRLGWLLVPEDLRRPIERLAQNMFIAAPTLSQLAAIAAFDATIELEANVEMIHRNRRIVTETLDRIGIPYAPPDGAFYVYADVSGLGMDSQRLVKRWLEESGVAITPGLDFDPVRGHNHIRFSYSESTADITEAMQRIERWAQDFRRS